VSQSYPDLIDDLNAIARLRAGAPEPMRGFSMLAREALKPGALDVKTKELVAMGIAIATRCDGCIGFHAKAAIKAGDDVRVSVRVRNTGARDGDEVVQLYVQKPGEQGAPALAGFTRVHLAAGESQLVTFDLDSRRLSLVDEQGARKVVPGRYVAHLGGGQPGHAATVKVDLSISGEDVLPR